MFYSVSVRRRGEPRWGRVRVKSGKPGPGHFFFLRAVREDILEMCKLKSVRVIEAQVRFP